MLYCQMDVAHNDHQSLSDPGSHRRKCPRRPCPEPETVNQRSNLDTLYKGRTLILAVPPKLLIYEYLWWVYIYSGFSLQLPRSLVSLCAFWFLFPLWLSEQSRCVWRTGKASQEKPRTDFSPARRSQVAVKSCWCTLCKINLREIWLPIPPYLKCAIWIPTFFFLCFIDSTIPCLLDSCPHFLQPRGGSTELPRLATWITPENQMLMCHESFSTWLNLHWTEAWSAYLRLNVYNVARTGWIHSFPGSPAWLFEEPKNEVPMPTLQSGERLGGLRDPKICAIHVGCVGRSQEIQATLQISSQSTAPWKLGNPARDWESHHGFFVKGS